MFCGNNICVFMRIQLFIVCDYFRLGDYFWKDTLLWRLCWTTRSLSCAQSGIKLDIHVCSIKPYVCRLEKYSIGIDLDFLGVVHWEREGEKVRGQWHYRKAVLHQRKYALYRSSMKTCQSYA